ncbi:hypothetical protein OWA38_003554 [Vibrio cholerae]|nr:hypothetical protein [Vibrio cholerae]GHZ16133.1 hypothetical protein VCSRO28_3448 [Vibrio cholerae]
MSENEVIKGLLLAAAPEKYDEIMSLWKQYEPNFSLREDCRDFSLSVIFGSVVFDHKSMCQMWLLGFAAQKAFHAYSPLIALSNLCHSPISTDSLPDDATQKEQLRQFSSLMDDIIKIKSISNISEFVWPANIPHPDQGKPQDVDGAMVFDLNCISGAYCFLHELQHIRFSVDGTELDVYQEEHACDKFARSMLLDDIERYSQSSGYDKDIVTSKRAMSIGLASFLLLAITSKDRWGQTDTHPKICDRIYNLTNELDLRDSDYFWLYFGSLALGIAYYHSITIKPMVASNIKEFCLSIVEALDASI